MVNKSFLLKLSKRLSELCEKHGVAANLEVVNYMDNECDVTIVKEIANERRDALDKICDELRKVEGVESIYDEGAGKILKGTAYRQFQILAADGLWTHTERDERASDIELRELFDDKYAAKVEKKRLKDKLKHWKEHIIPIPKASKKPPETAYLVLQYEPYDWIRRGEKKHEYRGYTERYLKMFVANKPKKVLFQRGYGGHGRSKPEQMVWTIKSVKLHDIRSDFSTDPYNPEPIVPTHVVIELGERVR